VVTYEGGFPIGWFIVGYGAWFRKPLMTNLQRDALWMGGDVAAPRPSANRPLGGLSAPPKSARISAAHRLEGVTAVKDNNGAADTTLSGP
jgi:hypothetical protein